MTAVLNEIRRLEEAERRGEISPVQMRLAKAELMNAVEDVDGLQFAEPERPPAVKQTELWHILVFCLCLAAFCTAVGTLLLGDLTLALTVTVTLLAVLSVRSFRHLGD
jgi:hypothetical protein